MPSNNVWVYATHFTLPPMHAAETTLNVDAPIFAKTVTQLVAGINSAIIAARAAALTPLTQVIL